MNFRRSTVNRIAMRLLPAAFLILQACGDDDPSGPDGGVTNLTSGVAVTNIDGGEDSERVYRISVPAGAVLLSVETSGGTGDVDLVVRHGSTPTPTNFDCESFEIGNAETCDIDDPDAGDWYILLYGFEEYDNVSLVATVDDGT